MKSKITIARYSAALCAVVFRSCDFRRNSKAKPNYSLSFAFKRGNMPRQYRIKGQQVTMCELDATVFDHFTRIDIHLAHNFLKMENVCICFGFFDWLNCMKHTINVQPYDDNVAASRYIHTHTHFSELFFLDEKFKLSTCL